MEFMIDGLSQLRQQRALFELDNSPLRLDEYQDYTRLTDLNHTPGAAGLSFALLGVFGETGSLLSELKKKQRDKDAYFAYRDSVLEEFGDTLWYMANAAQRAGLLMSVVAERAANSISDWTYGGTSAATTFLQLQRPQEHLQGPLTGTRVELRLLTLAGSVGRLVEDYSRGRIAENGDLLSADLIDIFRLLIAAADDAEVSLDEAARRNIVKVLSRWPIKREWGPPYDSAVEQDERLPSKIRMVFKEKDIGGRKYVIQQCNGINIGDRLTDNRIEPDDYRFHDVFHLAYAAILGWSPVIRSLFKLKRKSDPSIDENQDGARATLIEEGLATWVFNHGARHQYFRGVTSLDYGILKVIGEIVKGYEVQSRPLWQWEQAILEGFRVFRELQLHRGGTVVADIAAHTLSFELNHE
jgi:NTP pyrophosphatase (non-canonical NTP hydrolase)